MSASAALRRACAARIIRNTKMKERDRWIALWNYILANELELGTLFLRSIPDNQLYAVLGDTHQIVQLPRRGGDRWHSYFHTTYGLGEREKASGFIYDALRAYAFSRGEQVELRRFAAYNQATKTAYLSAYDGFIFKIESKAQITREPQGTDDLFFADDDGGIPIEPEIGPHGLLLPILTNPSFVEGDKTTITPAQQQMALTIWMFAVAFPDLLPAKPMLLLEGEAGSGKTSVIVLLHLILFGCDKPISLRKNKEDDFGVILLRNPIALFDNQDSYVEWLPDALCAYATGAQWEKRKLYSDDENVITKPRSFISFTTRNPASFRRDDVIDRSIILRFDRRKTFKDEAVLKAEILALRSKLLGEYLWYVERIVEELRKDDLDLTTHAYRMAAFVSFGRVVGRVLGWTDQDVEALMAALQAARVAFLTEDEPLIDLLSEWLKVVYNSRVKVQSNRGRLISVFDLTNELEHLAEVGGRPWKETPRTLGIKLRTAHIDAAFRIERHTLGGHMAFRIWRRSDPSLEVVGGGDLTAH